MLKRLFDCITGATQREIQELKSELELCRTQYSKLLRKNRPKRRYTRKTNTSNSKKPSK